ncbi:MAG: hypothetical protein P4L42_17110 [Desulfocapsaceae bacterium]|nr:hypothetical protein [Desulfocapsaceae bacterium]
MKDTSTLHQKVQELCDCFATTDPLKEMSKMAQETDTEQAALKWIALAVLHGINSSAESVSIVSTKDGKLRVTAQYRKAELPAPGPATARKAIAAIRSMTHMEDNYGTTTLAFGFRNSSMDLKINSVHEAGDDRVTIVFP